MFFFFSRCCSKWWSRSWQIKTKERNVQHTLCGSSVDWKQRYWMLMYSKFGIWPCFGYSLMKSEVTRGYILCKTSPSSAQGLGGPAHWLTDCKPALKIIREMRTSCAMLFNPEIISLSSVQKTYEGHSITQDVLSCFSPLGSTCH